jgi:hypothetical protein
MLLLFQTLRNLRGFLRSFPFGVLLHSLQILGQAYSHATHICVSSHYTLYFFFPLHDLFQV